MNDVKTRIQNAFLSEKNAESVFDQILSDAETKCGSQSLSECYDEPTLRNFQVSMMKYLWKMCSPQLQQVHLSSPKKTVFLLNALTLRRVVKAICAKIKERTTPSVGVLPAPPVLPMVPIPTRGYEPGGSVPIGYLAPKRRTVRIAKLQEEEDAVKLHVFWRRPDKRQALEEKYAQEIGFALPESHQESIGRATNVPQHNKRLEDLPWKYLTISSDSRTFGGTDAYTVAATGLDNIYRLCLHKVDIPLTVPLVSDVKKSFYFSEDDDPMHIIDLASERMLQRIASRSQPLSAALQDEMNDLGRHAYSIVKDRVSGRVTITQITSTSNASGRFSILFEQTRDNCAELLGFDRRNYQGDSRYEGSVPCADTFTARPDDSITEENEGNDATGTVSVRIPQLSDQAIVRLSANPGTDARKVHEFSDYVLYENPDLTTLGLTLDSLSVAFSLDEIAEHAVVGEHQFVFKCWYYSRSRINTTTSSVASTSVAEDEAGTTAGEREQQEGDTMDLAIERVLRMGGVKTKEDTTTNANATNPSTTTTTVTDAQVMGSLLQPQIIHEDDEDEMEVDDDGNIKVEQSIFRPSILHNTNDAHTKEDVGICDMKQKTQVTPSAPEKPPRRRRLPPLTLPLN